MWAGNGRRPGKDAGRGGTTQGRSGPVSLALPGDGANGGSIPGPGSPAGDGSPPWRLGYTCWEVIRKQTQEVPDSRTSSRNENRFVSRGLTELFTTTRLPEPASESLGGRRGAPGHWGWQFWVGREARRTPGAREAILGPLLTVPRRRAKGLPGEQVSAGRGPRPGRAPAMWPPLSRLPPHQVPGRSLRTNHAAPRGFHFL